MADWAQLETELPNLIGRLIRVPCDWRKLPRQMHVGPRAELDIVAERALGVDDRRWLVSGDGLRARVTGQRLMTLQITMWSPVQPLAQSARRYLEQLRVHLSFPSTLDALVALELALVDTHALVQLDPQEDGRRVSQASLDVRLAYALSDDDAPIPFIGRARLRSEVFEIEMEVPD